jgi:hypothetical protein
LITREQIIEWWPNPEEEALVEENARLAALGGRSQIHQGERREADLLTNQITGQLGELAVATVLLGDPQEYVRSRALRNADPWRGDGGNDFPGYPGLDAKTSFMRGSDNPLHYRLAVRPAERHAGQVYVSCLVNTLPDLRRVVYICGWALDDDLPKQPDLKGTEFAGAYTLMHSLLSPVGPLRDMFRDLKPQGIPHISEG